MLICNLNRDLDLLGFEVWRPHIHTHLCHHAFEQCMAHASDAAIHRTACSHCAPFFLYLKVSTRLHSHRTNDVTQTSRKIKETFVASVHSLDWELLIQSFIDKTRLWLQIAVCGQHSTPWRTSCPVASQFGFAGIVGRHGDQAHRGPTPMSRMAIDFVNQGSSTPW